MLKINNSEVRCVWNLILFCWLLLLLDMCIEIVLDVSWCNAAMCQPFLVTWLTSWTRMWPTAGAAPGRRPEWDGFSPDGTRRTRLTEAVSVSRLRERLVGLRGRPADTHNWSHRRHTQRQQRCAHKGPGNSRLWREMKSSAWRHAADFSLMVSTGWPLLLTLPGEVHQR